MRSVQVWTCNCGLRYKAVTEVDWHKVPKQQTAFVCPECGDVVHLDGVMVFLESEFRPGDWTQTASAR